VLEENLSFCEKAYKQTTLRKKMHCSLELQEAQVLLGMANRTGPVVKLSYLRELVCSRPGSWTTVLIG